VTPACCSDHPCDLCPTCLGGTCCGAVKGSSSPATPHTLRATLHTAIAADQATRPSTLADRLLAEARTARIRQLLKTDAVRRMDASSPPLDGLHRRPAGLPSLSLTATDLLTQHPNHERKHA
jgi:hypothetical protein